MGMKVNDISYEEIREIWEKEETTVHKDTSEKLVNEISLHIKERCKLCSEDNVLTIGCGDGLFDSKILSFVNKVYGMDFSKQKLSVARERNMEVEYFCQSFLDSYNSEILNSNINKIYSYEVMQYCKPDDIEMFLNNQFKLLTEDKEYIIAHLDVPDIDKSDLYYYRKEPENAEHILKEGVENNTLFGDGTCWHNMNKIKSFIEKIGGQCDICPAHYWDYRSDIVIRMNGSIIKNYLNNHEV